MDKKIPPQNHIVVSYEMFNEIFNTRFEKPLEDWSNKELIDEAILIKTKQSNLSSVNRKKVIEMVDKMKHWKRNSYE